MNLRKFHKYISLLVSLQLLLWTISGIYFSFNKIESVRGEQYYEPELKEEITSPIQANKISHDEAFKVIEQKTTLTPINIELIEDPKAGSEYRGRELPLYKVITKNTEGEEINVYQNPYSGEILAIRSQQWRIWDLMWGLHIMDWNERDNIGNVFLKIFSFIALLTAITGIILFFKRK
tara:strand:- start:956 stop:1489 length:534 start_codon:yes stop_codon:yes gene_type:complete